MKTAPPLPLRRALLVAAALAPLGCAAPGNEAAPRFVNPPPAPPAPPPPLNLLAAALVGSWKGELEVAGNPPTRGPAEIEISPVVRSSFLAFDYLRNDAGGNPVLVAERVRVDFDLGVWRAQVPATGEVSTWALVRVDRTAAPLRYDIVLQGPGRDGATDLEIRQTMLVTADTMEIVRSVRPLGSPADAPFATRLTYRLKRVVK